MAAKNSQQTPENYIRSGKARTLPIYECRLLKDFEETGMTNVSVARAHKNGNLTVGVYLVDLFCLGIKDSMFCFNVSKQEYEDKIVNASAGMIVVDYDFAHNLLFGADIYSEELGLKAHHSFKLTQYILDEDTEDKKLIEFNFGDKGMPHLVINPTENRTREINILTKNLGENGFRITSPEDIYDEDEMKDFDEQGFIEIDEEKFAELNDNDGIVFISRDDLRYAADVALIADEPDEEKKIELLNRLMDNEEASGPEFVTHSLTDGTFCQLNPAHKEKVNGIKFRIPEIKFENRALSWFPLELEKLKDEFDEIFCDSEDENEDIDFGTTFAKSMEVLQKKYQYNEISYLFWYTKFFEFEFLEGENEFTKEFLNRFQNSTFARAIFIFEKLSKSLAEERIFTENCVSELSAIVFQCPFKISAEYKFMVSNSVTNFPTLIEISSYLFIQGFYHLSQNRIAEAEACLKEMAKIRAKDGHYFHLLRNLLTFVKTNFLKDEVELILQK